MEDASSVAAPRYVLEAKWPHRAVPTTALAGAAALLNVGGGAGSGASAPVSAPITPAPTPAPETLTAQRAARFLSHASLSATPEQIARVQVLGHAD